MTEVTSPVNVGSFAEQVIERLTPMRWDEGEGRLALDAVRLAELGLMYVSMYLKMAAALLCLGFVVGDLWFSVSLTAKAFSLISVSGATALLLGAARTWASRRGLR